MKKYESKIGLKEKSIGIKSYVDGKYIGTDFKPAADGGYSIIKYKKAEILASDIKRVLDLGCMKIANSYESDEMWFWFKGDVR